MYRLTNSMRNQFYCEREQLKGKIEMIKKYLTLNHDFLLQSKFRYRKNLDNCKDLCELLLAEEDSKSEFADFEQIYLNGCLMYLISQYEYYMKEVYKKVCIQTKSDIVPFYGDIVENCKDQITRISCVKFFKCVNNTFKSIYDIIKLRNQLAHTDGKSYKYKIETIKHLEKHSNKVRIIHQQDGRIDVYVSHKYIEYVCNIVLYSFFSLTKSVHKKLNH